MAPLDYFKILRPANCLMAAAAVYIGFAVASGGIAFSWGAGLAMLSAFLVCGAGQAINDYFDRGIDAKGKKGRPIPSGRISAGKALACSAALFIAGIAISFLINIHAFAIAALISALLIFYSAAMRKIKFIGNCVVALGTAMTLIYGAAVVQSYSAITLLAASAFFANVAREIIKDAEDAGQERGIKRTLPMLVGKDKLDLAIMGLYLASIAFALTAWTSGLFGNVAYPVLIGASAAIFAFSYSSFVKCEFGASQKFSKYGMAVALAAFIAGVL